MAFECDRSGSCSGNILIELDRMGMGGAGSDTIPKPRGSSKEADEDADVLNAVESSKVIGLIAGESVDAMPGADCFWPKTSDKPILVPSVD